MIRRLAHVTAALCLAAIPLVLTLTAGADSASSFGWWYQLNDSNLLLAPPPPPGAPSGGIYVQGAPGGPSAYGAIHFSSPDSTAGVAKLTVESVNGPATVALCPTTSAWLPADGGTWQTAPTYDCTIAKSLGAMATDNKSITFPLTEAFASNGEYDLAIVPDPTVQGVFALSMSAPGSDFYTVTERTTTTLSPVTQPPPDPTTYDPGNGNTLGGYIPDSGGGSTSSNNFLSGPNAGATPSAPVPNAGAGTTGRPQGPIVAAPVSSTSSADRMMAGMGLALLAAGLWFIGNRTGSDLTPELLKAGAVSAHGGVGRFARVRTAIPTRVA